MDHDVDAIVRNAEQKVRLDHLERLVRQRRAVHGDLAPHLPGRMLQGVVQRRAGKTLARPRAEGSARGGEHETTHFAGRASADALENRAMLAVDRNELTAAVLRGVE